MPNQVLVPKLLCAQTAVADGGLLSALSILEVYLRSARHSRRVFRYASFVIDTRINFLVRLPFGLGTWQLRSRSPRMTDTELIEQSFQIAWSVLERTGELGEPNWSANFLLDEIIERFRCGERRRLVLSNCAIDAYRHQPVKLVS